MILWSKLFDVLELILAAAIRFYFSLRGIGKMVWSLMRLKGFNNTKVC